jgi:hypothetical protein
VLDGSPVENGGGDSRAQPGATSPASHACATPVSVTKPSRVALGFGPTLAAEKPREVHGMMLGRVVDDRSWAVARWSQFSG